MPPGDQLGEYPGEKPASEAADGENPAALGVMPMFTPEDHGKPYDGVAMPCAYGVICGDIPEPIEGESMPKNSPVPNIYKQKLL